ncbi:MAG: DUF452 family protein [Muribaculaceae bacterium]|nr:DUF452 family protein [Muribaculaceae bacterium]
MNIEFIKRGAATRLILLFAGWSTDARYYSDCIVDGWDTAVVSDYRDLALPELPAQYSTIYIFAYSLGVFAASQCNIDAAARIAICGSEFPVSDEYGIPSNVYKATADGLDTNSLKKFHRRMAGDRASISRIDPMLPESPDIDALKNELYAIAAAQSKMQPVSKWDKVYIAKQDRIFPFENLNRYWSKFPETVKVDVDSSHAIEIPQIIKDVIPNPTLIGEGFSIATETYKKNALVQAEICDRIGEILKKKLRERQSPVDSLLEIGVGRGLLTEVWQNILKPTKATFVDLLPMPEFGIAKKEEYIVADAEEWIKGSSSKYDVILSASTIQWFANPINFIRTVKSRLNTGGFAIISSFTKGNLHQLDEIRPCPLIYHSAEEYKQISDITAEEWERTLNFSSPREMLMHLRHTGVSPRRSSSSIPLSTFPTKLTYRPIILLIHASQPQ